jgi:hypothetical protein
MTCAATLLSCATRGLGGAASTHRQMASSRAMSEPACIRCGITAPHRLYACQLARWYRRPDGRPTGRSLGPLRVCRSCVRELLAVKTNHEDLRTTAALR